MILNLKGVKVLSLDGTDLRLNVSKLLANTIYEKTGTLDWLEIAQSLNREEEVNISSEDLEQIMAVIKHPQCGLILAVKHTLLTYLNKLKEENPQKA